MDGLLKSVEALLVQRLLYSGESFIGKSKVGWGLMFLATLLLFTGICFICVGAYLWLAKNYTPDVAAISMGGIFLAIAIGLAGLGFYTLRYRHHYIRSAKNEFAACMTEARIFANDELEKVIAENPKLAVLFAALSGFLAHEHFS